MVLKWTVKILLLTAVIFLSAKLSHAQTTPQDDKCEFCDPRSLCDPTTGDCSQCLTGYGPDNSDGGRCKPCHEHCTGDCHKYGVGTCDSQCTNGYGIQGSTCVECSVKHCAGGCNVELTECDGPCEDGYALELVNWQCIPCAKGCKTCSKQHECNVDGCGDGYAYKDLICIECARNCVGCETPLTCNGTCKDGYIFDANTKTCKQCDPKCTDGCRTNLAGKCDGTCEDGHGVSDIDTCIKCDEHCSSTVGCNTQGGGFCDSLCVDGWGIGPAKSDSSKKSCYPCAEHCTGGCATEGAGCCDTDACSAGTWKLETGSTTCHICT